MILNECNKWEIWVNPKNLEKKKTAWYFAKVIDIFAMHKMICLCNWQDGSLCDCNVSEEIMVLLTEDFEDYK